MKHAAWVLALCACGDGIAAPDALVPDADDGRGVVEVQVLTIDIFRHTSVYFQERDSTLSLATRLDEDGRARGYLHPGGFVTVVPEVVSNITSLYTYANVSPGDTLVIDPGQTLKGGAQARILIPALIGTQFYTLETPCAPPMDVSMASIQSVIVDLSGCGDHADLLFVAHAEAGDVFFFENDVPLSTAPVPPLLDYRNRSYRAFEDSTTTVVGIPPKAEHWFIEKAVALGSMAVHPVGTSKLVEDGTVSVSSAAPLLPEITALTTTGPDSLETDTFGLEGVIDWRPSTPEITIDLRDYDLRPQIAPAKYIPEASSIVWSEATSGTPAQATIARMQWVTPSTLYQWTILGARGDEARLEVPILPRTELTPDPHSPPYDLYRIAVSGGAANVLHRLLGWTPSVRWPVEGDTGTVIYQRLAQ